MSSLIKIGIVLTAYLVGGIVFSIGVLRAFSIIFTKLGQYHPLESEGSGDSTNETKTEDMLRKCTLVWFYNLSMVFLMGAMVYTYSRIVLHIEIDIVIWALLVAAIFSLIFTFSIRVSALSSLPLFYGVPCGACEGCEDSGSSCGEKGIIQYKRVISFGHAFASSIFFITLLGAGFGVLPGNSQSEVMSLGGSDISSLGWSSLLLIIALVSILLTVLSEWILKDRVRVETIQSE